MNRLRGRAGIAGGTLILAALGGLALPAVTTTAPAIAGTTATQGVDVSSLQHPATTSTINWPDVASSGVYFAGVKASEGSYYVNPYYAGDGAKNEEADAAQAVDAGLYVTPYVFANPQDATTNSGKTPAQTQADDGAAVIKASTSPAYSGSHMLPVTLDIEPDPYVNSDGTNSCYGLSQSAMRTWISQFLTEIKKDLGTSKTPIIYTTADWWDACTGDYTGFSADPLWLASYGVTNPALPAGWNNYTIWQYGQGNVGGISGVDEDELGPVLQVSQAGEAIGPVQLRTLTSLAGTATTYPSSTGLPSGLTLNSSTGLITGTPTTADIGSHTVTVATNGVPSSMSFTWDVHGTITVTSPGNRTTSAGTPVSLKVAVTDQDGSGYPATISMSGLPTGLTYNSAGLITGWPTQPGTYTVHVSASDNLYASGSATFTWTISAASGGYAGQVRQVGGTAKCLDDPAYATANGTKVDLWACNGGSNQKWTVVQDGTIRVLGKCLAESGTTVELWSCSSGSSNQEWLAGSDGALVNAQSRECLYFADAKAGNGSRPTIAPCDSANQSGEQWSRLAANIFSGDPGKCLAVSGSTLETAGCANTSAQHWLAEANGTLQLGSDCLTEPSGATAGSVLTYGSCSGAATWNLVATPSTGNAIVTEIQSAADSALCATASGTEVVLGTCSTGPSSTWHVE